MPAEPGPDGEAPTVLWAPWRMAYVGQATHEPAPGCLFCGLAAGDPANDAAGLVVARRQRCLMVLNRYPYNPGHLMVVPLAHTGDLLELEAADRAALMEGAAEAVAALRRLEHPDGFNLGFNLGRAAGAGIAEHLHLHVVPRWSGDTNFMPVLADVKVIPEHLEETWRRLSAELRTSG